MKKITLKGNLGDNVKQVTLPPNPPFWQFQLAVNEKVQGEKKTTWFRCNAQYLSDKVVPFLTKGTQLIVHGDLKVQDWTDKEGKEKYTLTVRVDYIDLAGGADNNSSAEPTQQPTIPKPQEKYTPPPLPDVSAGNGGSDDLPF